MPRAYHAAIIAVSPETSKKGLDPPGGGAYIPVRRRELVANPSAGRAGTDLSASCGSLCRLSRDALLTSR
jgi:hypothetical protein